MFFFWCKDTMFFASTVGISPKGVGENPYFFYFVPAQFYI